MELISKATAKHVNKLKPLHILLVEDNVLNTKLISVLFAQHNIPLQFSQNGMEAIELIKTNHFDMVLMDMQMPLMNGYQATGIIRGEFNNKVPIIALTANASPGEAEKCLAYGMNAYICKPVDAAILFETMYRIVRSNKTPSIKKHVTGDDKIPVADGKVCNMDYLMSASRGNKKIINIIIAGFFKDTKKELVFLNNAIETSNYHVISHISHKIKSAFSILGISLLEAVFTEMEQLSNSTSGIVKIEQLNRRVHLVFKQAKAEMKAAV